MTKLLLTGRLVVTLSIAVLATSLVVAAPAAAGVCLDAPAGLLGRWPGDGTTAEVAHGRDGTVVGGTSYLTGEVDQAFSFDGVNDMITVPDDPDWSLDGDFTIDTWVNFAGFPGHSIALVAQDEGDGLTKKWILYYGEAGDLGFQFGTEATAFYPVSASWSPNLSEWYHVAVTRSGSNFTLYINGVAVDTGTESMSIPDAAAPLTLGWGETNWFVNGRLDEPEIYQRALSGAEIDAIHDAGSTPRCAITQSTLSLTGPGTAYPGETVTLDGALGLSDGATVDAQEVAISRTIDGGTPTSLPGVTTTADGTFSFQDTPGDGLVVYRATFAGATNVSAENAFETVTVGTQASALSVTPSASRVDLGDRVTIRAHLNGGGTNRTVAIWAVPHGASKIRLKRAEVNASGNLSVRHRPTRETEYYATYGGDLAWEPDTSPRKTVRVVPRWDITVLGGYATVGGVRLYHYSSLCGPNGTTGCPAARFVLQPRHPRQLVSFEGRYCHNGSCVRDNSSFRLNRDSKTWVWVYYVDRSIIGWRLDFRLKFDGDEDHLGATTRWVKTRVTA